MRALVLGVVVVLALVGVWLFRSQRAFQQAMLVEARAAAEAARHAANLEAEYAEQFRREEAQIGAQGSARLPESSATWEITGFVRLREASTGVPDIEVVASTKDGDQRSVRTAADGRFSFQFERATRIDQLEARPGPSTTRTLDEQDRDATDGSIDELVLWVTQGATVAGRVVDESGRPLLDVEVVGWCKSNWYGHHAAPDRATRSGSGGTFVLQHLGPELTVEARAQGRVSIRALTGELPAGSEARGLELVLVPAISLQGRVVDQGRRPVEQAKVEHSQDESDGDSATGTSGLNYFRRVEVSATTDADGRFHLAQVPLGATQVTCHHPRYLVWEGGLEPAREDNEIVLAQGALVMGRVVDRAGQAIEGATVAVSDGGQTRRTRSDAEGRFDIAGLESSQSGYAGAVAAGFATRVEPLDLSAEDIQRVELVLGPGFSISGRVVDAQREPVAGVPLRIAGERAVKFENVGYGERTTWEWWLGLSLKETDELGRFHFESLNPGLYRLETHPWGRGPKVVVEALAGAEEVEITLDEAAVKGVVFAGDVRDSRSGEALTEYRLTPMFQRDRGMYGSGHSIQNAQGRFRIAGLDEGTYELLIKASDYSGWRSGVAEYRAGEYFFSVVLMQLRTLRLRALDHEARPVPSGTQVSFRDSRDQHVWVEIGAGTTTTSITLRDGEAIAQGLPADLITLDFRLPKVEEVQSFPIDLRVEPQGVQTFTLSVPKAQSKLKLQFLVAGSRRDADVSRYVGEPQPAWVEDLERGEEVWLIAENLGLALHDHADRQVGAGICSPTAEGPWQMQWTSRGNASTQPASEFPVWSIEVLEGDLRLTIVAEGYEPRRVDLDTQLPNAGLPPILFLQRK